MRRKSQNEIGRHSAFLAIAAFTFAIVDSQLLNLPASIPRPIKSIIAMSFVTMGLNIYDKIASRQKVWVYKKCRVPDLVLHLMEVLGGSFVSLLFQRATKHKCASAYRQIQVAIIAVQLLVGVMYLVDPEIPPFALWAEAQALGNSSSSSSSSIGSYESYQAGLGASPVVTALPISLANAKIT
mmetsp:Transcript_878/g.1410  ORF Transcript_878/g.1410 Transcript_878/m.1410 type:complete len:183 (+) Transcript_878:97-645(+)